MVQTKRFFSGFQEEIVEASKPRASIATINEDRSKCLLSSSEISEGISDWSCKKHLTYFFVAIGQ